MILDSLVGIWKGHGRGDYPTIDAFRYEESLRFVAGGDEPLVHYEQRTWLVPSREPSHWESGFVMLTEDGALEILNAQNSGRVEVLRGRHESSSGADLSVVFDHVVLDHDERMLASRRVWTVRGDALRYEVHMATRTTPEPMLQKHLEAELVRDG